MNNRIMENIRTTIGKDGDIMYCLSDIAKELEMKDPSKLSGRIPKEEKTLISLGEGLGNTLANFVTRRGLELAICNSLKPKAMELAKRWNLSMFVATKEQKYLSIIEETFKHIQSIHQFTVYDYRVDLYFPTLKLAIECDENGHKHLGYKDELQRQNTIERALGCTFIRFNPDIKGFNIGTVINEIMTEIYKD